MDSIPTEWLTQVAVLVAVVNMVTGFIDKIAEDAVPTWKRGRGAVMRGVALAVGLTGAFTLHVAVGSDPPTGYIMAGLLAAWIASGGSSAWKRARNLVAAKVNAEALPPEGG